MKSEERRYIGQSDGTVYVCDGRGCTLLDPRFDLRNHSQSGFAWGYGGSGPAQLALAILADALGDDAKAKRLYQEYKERVISHLPQGKPWGPLPIEDVRRTAAELKARQNGPA